MFAHAFIAAHRTVSTCSVACHLSRVLRVFALVLMSGCAFWDKDPDAEHRHLNDSPWAKAHRLPLTESKVHWTHQHLPARAATRYHPTWHEDRPALHALSMRGDSLIRLPVRAEGPHVGRLRFSWFVNALNPAAELGNSALDDAVVRVILQFDGDKAPFSARDHRLSDLVQLATGEPLPHATLMYVWDHRHPAGTLLRHPRTDRVRVLVVASGEAMLGRWVDFERDIAADYEQAFGKPPVRLTGLALMTDANNTGQRAEAWYGPITWSAYPVR